ncbi:MAG TPA: ATP-binding protein [Thermomicrobiales bacterium]|nr:ATP-binding protein [Thermomicrobiales bacterium]
METRAAPAALDPEQLRRRLDPATLPYSTTTETPPLTETIGQPRAISAIEFALAIQSVGFNLFVAGAPGSGRETIVVEYLRGVAGQRPTPSDWVYVYNFTDADHPNAIQLPAGQGALFAVAMQELVVMVRDEVARAFESEEYDRRRREVLNGIGARRNELFARLSAFALTQQFALDITPAGITNVPLIENRPLAPAEFAALPEEQRADIDRRAREVQEQLASTMIQVHALDREAADRVLALDREVTLFVVQPLLDHVRERYAAFPDVLAHIDNLQQDFIAHYQELRVRPGVGQAEAGAPALPWAQSPQAEYLTRYDVNVLVDNGATSGAPVIIERNPTYYNLIGRMDYRAVPGAMMTDFRQIKPGALHLANGGFLVLHVGDVLRQPFAWEALKRALLCQDIRVETLAAQQSPLPAASLRPEPIPLDIKVILLGSALDYRLLFAADEDFEELFKVKAEFAPDMLWTAEHVDQYVAFISRWVRDNDLKHLTRAAIAKVIEHGARLREHQQRLSTRMRAISDLLTEANHWAVRAGHDLIEASDIEQAIDMKEYRSNLVAERLDDLIADGTIDIDTDGERAGQVNGLSVLDIGDHAFGKPSRVSARVSLGRGQILSIDREIAMSGPIHSKGFLTLTGYLGGQYARDIPLAMSASITFEQSYEGVDGDSASSTELYALLSALSGVPIRQGIAVTGSVNQYGEVQAVGGVTRKIEGFFAVCQTRGLTGQQGVLIPATNVRNLMLSDEVVEAARAGLFHVWAVNTIDEGIELLTGVPAGERAPDGSFPEGSVHDLVQQRLRAFAEDARRFATPFPPDILPPQGGVIPA